jgi:YD repeat-containing protein
MYNHRLYIFILSILLGAILGACSLQEPIEQNLLGKKIKTEIKYLADYNSKNKISIVTYKLFDRNGKLNTFIEYDNTGNLFTRSQFLYDGNNSKEIIIYYNQNGNIDSTRQITHKFNTDGKVISKTIVNEQGNVISITEFDYDARGNLIRKIQINPSTENRSETSFDYSFNDDGKVIERNTDLNSDGAIDIRDSVFYTNNDRTVSVVSFDSDGFIQITHTFQYNTLGMIVNETVIDQNHSILEYFIYEYTFY